MSKADYIWMNRRCVRWEDARLHVTSEVVLRGASVFEGLRGYPDEKGNLQLFRVPEHLLRFRQSAKVLRLPIDYSDAELTLALCELVQKNSFREQIHIRMTAYFGEGKSYSFDPADIAHGIFIFALPNKTKSVVAEGIASGTSTWRRSSDDAGPSRIKASANYYNSRLAQVEASLRGFDVPIMLNASGHVAESPSSCFFMVRDNVLVTPSISEDILESITRDTIIKLARLELGLCVVERAIDRSELYICDEAFLSGTSHEVLPIHTYDGYAVGNGGIGPVTTKLQDLYFGAVSGRLVQYNNWLTPVSLLP